MEIVVGHFGTLPPLALEEWEFESLDARDYDSPRALALYSALGADPTDYEYSLARHRSEDRWALFGMTVEGHPFAIEVLCVSIVLNLATGEELTFFIPAREAVIAAYAQSQGDYNTWDYERRYGALVIRGRLTWGLGDFAAMV